MRQSGLEGQSLEQIRALCAGGPLVAPPPYPAQDYLDRLKPHLRGFGISRLADITGLDRLGVPVVQAIRPRALSNAVNQGKGLTLAEAAVSAVVEALETYACEQLDRREWTRRRPADLFGKGARALSCHLAPNVPQDWAEDPVPCVPGIDAGSGQTVEIPLALISTDYSPASHHAATPFMRTTTGLGGGATLDQAIVHGFLEVLERQSTERALTTHGFFERCRLALDGLADADVADRVAQLQSGGLLVAAYEAPPIGPFPTLWVRLLDERAGPVTLPFPSDGFACQPSVKGAFQAAFLEAVQTRGAVIAGGREDITWRYYPKTRDNREIDFERRQIKERQGGMPSSEGCTGPVTLKGLANALATLGRDAVIVPVLSQDEIPLHVVRVVPLVAAPGGTP